MFLYLKEHMKEHMKEQMSVEFEHQRNRREWFDEIDEEDDYCQANEIQHETICMTAEMEFANGKKEFHYNAHGPWPIW